MILTLGEGGHMGYGRQRVWGSIGWGVTALTAGYAMDLVSEDDHYKSYTPAFILVIVFTFFDVLSCTKLEVPYCHYFNLFFIFNKKYNFFSYQ